MIAAVPNGKVKVWDAGTGKLICTFSAHMGTMSIAFSPDSKRLAMVGASSGDAWSKSKDGRKIQEPSGDITKLLDPRTGKEVWRHVGKPDAMRCAVAFSPDGSRLATTGSRFYGPGDIAVLDASTGALVRSFGEGSSDLNIVFRKDGRSVVITSPYRFVEQRDAQKGTIEWTWRPPVRGDPGLSGIVGMAISPDDSLVAAAGWEETDMVDDGASARFSRVWVRDAKTGAEVRSLTKHHKLNDGEFWAGQVAFTPDGRGLAAIIWSYSKPHVVIGKLKIWNLKSGRLRQVITDPGTRIGCFCFTPGGKTVVTGSVDGTLKLWDVAA